jgi:hypothetical protein
MKHFFTIIECITLVLSLVLVTVQFTKEDVALQPIVVCIA